MNVKRFPVINMEATGANILRLRKERNLSVADMQEYFGFDAPQAIYKWQRGETLPSTDNLLALGYLLGVPIEDILVSNADSGSDANDQPQGDSCGDCVFLESGIPVADSVLFIFSFTLLIPFLIRFNYGFNDFSPSCGYNAHMKEREE